jgi:hypothetical protein
MIATRERGGAAFSRLLVGPQPSALGASCPTCKAEHAVIEADLANALLRCPACGGEHLNPYFDPPRQVSEPAGDAGGRSAVALPIGQIQPTTASEWKRIFGGRPAVA